MKITLHLTLPSISAGEEAKQQPCPLLLHPSQSCENFMVVLGLSPRNGVCFLSFPVKVFTRYRTSTKKNENLDNLDALRFS